MSITDQINELCAELAGCVPTKAERAAIEAELAALLAEHAALETVEAGGLFEVASDAPASC